MGGGDDEFERRKMEALGYIWSGGGWLTTGIDTGDTITVRPYQKHNHYTTTDGYGSGYVAVPGQPSSLGSNVPGVKSLAQIQQEKAYFEQVVAEAEKRLSATRARMQLLTAEVNALSGGGRLRKQTALAVESVEEITLEAELDGARANAIHADLSMQGRLSAGGLPHYSEAQNSEKRQKRDALRNGIAVKNKERERRVAQLNRLNAELVALDAGQDIREITTARELEDTGNRVNALLQEQKRLVADISSKNTLSAEAHARAEVFKQRRGKIQFVYDEMKQREYESEMNRLYRENEASADQLTAQAGSSQQALNDVSAQLDMARDQQAAKQQQLDAVRAQVVAEKAEAEKRLTEARQQEEAAQRALEQHQKAKAEADAKAKNEEETRQREKEQNEKEALTKASELISDVGEKISAHLGDKYREVAKQIADDIKNFQGKTIRNYEDAMKSLNKITSNPNMKINKADKDAIINAWKNINAQDMANKLDNLGKAFKVADVVQKIEKVREKSIEGYETGNWGPLMLEVESWVLSAIFAGVAIGILGSMLSLFLVTGSITATVLTIIGIISISILASFIDDRVADKINNEVIPSVH